MKPSFVRLVQISIIVMLTLVARNAYVDLFLPDVLEEAKVEIRLLKDERAKMQMLIDTLVQGHIEILSEQN